MREPDMQKLDALVGRLVGDVGAAMSGALVVLGDKVGLFKAMADGTPMSVQDLAAKTGVKERYVREWLSAQAAADYVAYDEKTDRFSLTPEQAMVFAQENSPAFFVGAFEVVQAMWMDEPKVADAFRTGKGLGWHEHSTCLFRGTEGGSFVRAITAISSMNGFRLLQASRKSSRPEPTSPMSAAVMVPRPS
jgi:hypothetical protein